MESARPGSPAIPAFPIDIAWLFLLRRAALAGQFLTILFVRFGLGIPLPMVPLLAIVGTTALSVAILETWQRRRPRDLGRRIAGVEGFVMVFDTVLLTGLLYYTGGPENPFAIFYLVHILLAAVLLGGGWALGLMSLSGVCYLALFVRSHPLEALRGTGDVAHMQINSLRLYGLFAAFAATAGLLIYFVSRIKAALAKRDRALADERDRRARREKVDALVTLTAGAAHELATPLSTIAVVVGELESELKTRAGWESGLGEDFTLIKQELRRCRGILDQMAGRAGDPLGEGLESLPLDEFIQEVIDPLRAAPRLRLEWSGEESPRTRVEVPRKALRRALRGLVKNALDASPEDKPVDLRIEASPRNHAWTLRIEDRGEGMSPEVLARAGDPFFTTKSPGSGMGLGIYLARSVIERLGGELEISSVQGQGTTMKLRLPLSHPRDGAGST